MRPEKKKTDLEKTKGNAFTTGFFAGVDSDEEDLKELTDSRSSLHVPIHASEQKTFKQWRMQLPRQVRPPGGWWRARKVDIHLRCSTSVGQFPQSSNYNNSLPSLISIMFYMLGETIMDIENPHLLFPTGHFLPTGSLH